MNINFQSRFSAQWNTPFRFVISPLIHNWNVGN